jgi:UDP-N-acetyl-D-glucosamine dehydrogenase
MSLLERIENRTAVVGVMGLGYVGLPLLRVFWDAGFRVLGFDVDPEKVRLLKRGESYLKHLGEDLVRKMVEDPNGRGRFDATSDPGRLGEADAILICVPTPLGQHMDPDLSFVEDTANDIARTLRPGQLIVLESTTYPGTTREVVLPRLQVRDMRCGTDFYLAYSPEREDPGRKDHSTRTIPKLVGGIDAASAELARKLYGCALDQVISVSTAEVAEATKLLENIYRAVNIALVNEMKVLFAEMKIDIWEVVEAAKSKPFGFQAFYPGPGLGGHCIPIDPFYLTWKAREVGRTTRFIELAGEINRHMPAYVVERVVLAMNGHGKAVQGSRILVLGLAYKPDVDDVRESPSFELIEHLQKLGAKVDYNDPLVPSTHKMRRHDLGMSSVALTEQVLAGYDCVLIATNHRDYDWRWIGKHAKLIVDTRGVMRSVPGGGADVVTA